MTYYRKSKKNNCYKKDLLFLVFSKVKFNKKHTMVKKILFIIYFHIYF
jgi:hypothetical protein